MGETSVVVQQRIEILYDEARFTSDFMATFRKHFYNFEEIKDHIEHIATCFARGVISNESEFLEGYGKLSDFGIKVKRIETWIDN